MKPNGVSDVCFFLFFFLWISSHYLPASVLYAPCLFFPSVVPGTKQTGVNYRHYGGGIFPLFFFLFLVERESVTINSELVDENGVLKVSLPKEVYQSNIDDSMVLGLRCVDGLDDLANYNVKWRKAKLKENNLSLKFVLIGSGDVYIALSSTDEKPNPQDIIKDGYSVCLLSLTMESLDRVHV